jgi:hypothetical protein
LNCFLHNLGLIDPSYIRHRRHSSEDFDRKSSAIINMTQLNESNEETNIEKLQEIIRNLNKYIQQLQMRIRINTPDVTLERLTEQNKVLISKKKFMFSFRLS